jgi:hypothetical protein
MKKKRTKCVRIKKNVLFQFSTDRSVDVLVLMKKKEVCIIFCAELLRPETLEKPQIKEPTYSLFCLY